MHSRNAKHRLETSWIPNRKKTWTRSWRILKAACDADYELTK